MLREYTRLSVCPGLAHIRGGAMCDIVWKWPHFWAPSPSPALLLLKRVLFLLLRQEQKQHTYAAAMLT
jgi:hypothetical protein